MNGLFNKKRENLKTLFHLREKEKVRKNTKLHVCPLCEESISQEELRNNVFICPRCQGYLSMPAYARIENLSDEKSFKVMKEELKVNNPLNFYGYDDKLDLARERTGLSDAIVIGTCKIDGHKVALGVMDNRFMMASMGTVVGEKLTYLIEYASRKNLPLVLVISSGGARMQEGIFSLMQMAKTTQAIERYKLGKKPYIALLTHPTTGGVWASFASIADITLAENNALIGFAGPRVIQNTIGEILPEGFQRSEYQLEHGAIDQVINREEVKNIVSLLLNLHEGA
jgi:acetyl-coA carboxylase, carboxyl transferase, beta subunit